MAHTDARLLTPALLPHVLLLLVLRLLVHCCLQLLDFLDRFLTANCLQDDYMLAHGTILGAVSGGTVGVLRHCVCGGSWQGGDWGEHDLGGRVSNTVAARLGVGCVWWSGKAAAH